MASAPSAARAQVVLELWGEAETLEGLQAAVGSYPEEERIKWGSPEQVGVNVHAVGFVVVVGVRVLG